MTIKLHSLLPKLRFPIFQAPMAGVSTPALAAAVSQAGGLGALGLGAASPEQAFKDIQAAQDLGAELLNVNLFCHASARRNPEQEQAWIDRLKPAFARFNAEPPARLTEIYPTFSAQPAMLEMLLETAPAVASFHFGLPPAEAIERLHARGIVTAATATNIYEARQIAAAGIKLIIAQGIEAGGHRGCFDPQADDSQLTTLVLVKEITQKLSLPVIAAGGIMDGADIAQALKAGASAAQLGTAFISCSESSASPRWRELLLHAQGVDTALTAAISGRPARGIINRLYDYQEGIPDYPLTYSIGKALHQAAAAHNCHDYAAYWAGSEAHRSRAMTASNLMAVLAIELEQATSSQ